MKKKTSVQIMVVGNFMLVLTNGNKIAILD